MVTALKHENKILKMIFSLIMVFSLMLSVTLGINKAYVHAQGQGNTAVTHGVGDTSVTLDKNGKLTIKGGGLGYTDGASAWNSLIAKFRFFVVGVTGLGTVAMILFFAYNFMKLGSTADNDQARAKVIKGLVWSAIAAAGLGSVTIFVGFFYNALRDM